MRLLALCIGLAFALAPLAASADSTTQQFGEWVLQCRGPVGPKNCIIAQSVEDEKDPARWIALNVLFNRSDEPEMRIVAPGTALGKYFALMVLDEKGFVPMSCSEVRCEKVKYEKSLMPIQCGEFYCEGAWRLGKTWITRVAQTQEIDVEYRISMLHGIRFTLKMPGLQEALDAVIGKKQ
ncbi:MAG TPA: hypothetical protein VMH91_02195 [Candidatus Paceibacterota bacterium]|nr:hypothetical protein [Candidatus Paceibacterota bacterium]